VVLGLGVKEEGLWVAGPLQQLNLRTAHAMEASLECGAMSLKVGAPGPTHVRNQMNSKPAGTSAPTCARYHTSTHV
jgi:hypothetical protein